MKLRIHFNYSNVYNEKQKERKSERETPSLFFCIFVANMIMCKKLILKQMIHYIQQQQWNIRNCQKTSQIKYLNLIKKIMASILPLPHV
jgi:hypothetical protein